MTRPVRIQRERTKGWRMPENTIYVGRPTKWGNPFRIGHPDPDDCMTCSDAAEAVSKYRSELTTFGDSINFTGLSLSEIYLELRGKNLACWCPLVDKEGKRVPCHGDVLLELANR